MYAAEIQRTDFQAAVDDSGHLHFDNRRIDALFAMGHVGWHFFARNPQREKEVLGAISALQNLLRLALYSLIDNTVHPRRRFLMLRVVRDVISCMRDVGGEGKAYLTRGTYWEPLILGWLTVRVEDPDTELDGDLTLSHLLITSDQIFTDATYTEDQFLAQVYAKATGEDLETKAKHIISVALERIRRATPHFKATRDRFPLTACLNALFLLYQTNDTITIFQRSLRVHFVILDGVHDLKDILCLGVEYASRDILDAALGVLFRHFCAVASSTTIQRSLDIGLIKAVLDASKLLDNLKDIGHFSVLSIVRTYIPESFVLRSVVKAFDVEELNSSLSGFPNEQVGWTNIVNLHNSRRLRYHALMRRNGKERIFCANVSAYIHCHLLCSSMFNIPLHLAGL